MQEIDQPSLEESVGTEQDAGTRKAGIGLCLSGGGYRAALFHLGVLRCLSDMGILQRVERISSVSGGSIISAYLARRLFEEKITSGAQFTDFESQVAAGFRAFVRNDIRTIPFFAHILWNWLMPKWRARHLQRNYSRLLLTVTDNAKERELRLGDLPSTPEFVFCASDISFGINWEFRRDRVGDFRVGYADKPEWPLALAVAASSCFPPIFGPMRLDLDPKEFKRGAYRKPDREGLVQRLKLSDGGVYDNFGLEPVDRGFETILISNGGSPFGYLGTANPIQRLMRYTAVMMNQVVSLRVRMFFTGITKGWHKGAYIDIGHERKTKPAAGNSFDGYVDAKVREKIAGIRTDLDRFTEAEACILENHGYYETFRRIKEKIPEMMSDQTFEGITPHPEWTDGARVMTALAKSDKRLVISRLLGLDR